MGRPGLVQGRFGFIDRSQKLARRFKLTISLVTFGLVFLLLAGTSNGRYLSYWVSTRARWIALQAVGIPPDRAEIDNDWKQRRLHDIEQTRDKLRGIYAEYGPEMRRLLDFAGLDPDHAVLRWGNFDRTLYLPSTVFEPDETGRSYRFRPNTKSIWLRNLRLKGGILAYFPLPVDPRLPDLLKGTGAILVDESVQTTNSWGLRGPEPDLHAPLRGIILGDSYMQGLFVGDDQTPCECLKRFLSAQLGMRTEILNTGHLGYSTEQEYQALREYADRFHPQFVVLSLFANDFGDLFEVLDGKGDWKEGEYWLGQITQFCRTHGLQCLVVPAPWVNQLENSRNAGYYPGEVSNILESSGMDYLDPIEDFANELLRIRIEQKQSRRTTSANPLFNGHLGDGHFSPLGCEVWARSVGTRLRLLLEYHHLIPVTHGTPDADQGSQTSKSSK
jgi:hypothetical protein